MVYLLEEICLNVFWSFLHLGFLSIIVYFWTKYHLRRDMFSSWTLFLGQCLYFYVYCISSMAPRQHVRGNMRKLGGTRANLGQRCSFKGTFRIPENLFDLDSCRPYKLISSLIGRIPIFHKFSHLFVFQRLKKHGFSCSVWPPGFSLIQWPGSLSLTRSKPSFPTASKASIGACGKDGYDAIIRKSVHVSCMHSVHIIYI